jgi:rSAM/selenodomain-associated transferase 2
MSEAQTSLAVVIPALDASAALPVCFGALYEARQRFHLRTAVADGGSSDDTREVARALGARVVTVRPGRGGQLAAGAGVTESDWLLFLHADTVLAPGWSAAAADFVADPANQERAAVFRFALDDESDAARRLERIVAWRCRALGLPYGDQGLLIARAFYESIGGFRPLALMEDVDIVRRIGKKRIVILDSPAITSAARYRTDGYTRRMIRNFTCLGLYALGVPPKTIARIYG